METNSLLFFLSYLVTFKKRLNKFTSSSNILDKPGSHIAHTPQKRLRQYNLSFHKCTATAVLFDYDYTAKKDTEKHEMKCCFCPRNVCEAMVRRLCKAHRNKHRWQWESSPCLKEMLFFWFSILVQIIWAPLTWTPKSLWIHSLATVFR